MNFFSFLIACVLSDLFYKKLGTSSILYAKVKFHWDENQPIEYYAKGINASIPNL